MEFRDTIIGLIESKKEGNYWDFKSEPHANNHNLLHDIICLANSVNKKNKYLIIGVADNYDIKGLSEETKNRKKQADIIDFLRTKDFAGDVRPDVEVRTLVINKKEIDVIIIKDKPLKPYYLVNRCGKVNPNNIYTRNGDTNTPINESADLYLVEKMWRERFGIDLSALERLKILLQNPNEWNMLDYRAFNKIYPEFTIEFNESQEYRDELYVFYNNEKCYFGELLFKYHNTIIHESKFAYLDEMRVFIPKYERFLLLKQPELKYLYYTLDSIEGQFLKLLVNKKYSCDCFEFYFNPRQYEGKYIKREENNNYIISDIKPPFYEPFIVFENQQEKECFDDYLSDSRDKIDDIDTASTAIIDKSNESKEMIEKLKIFLKIKTLHYEFKQKFFS